MVKAEISEAALLMTTLTGSSAKLAVMLIFMTRGAIGRRGTPALPAMTALAFRSFVRPSEWPAGDLVAERLELIKAAGLVTIFTAQCTKNAGRVRIFMAAHAALDLHRTEAGWVLVTATTFNLLMKAREREASLLLVVEAHASV